MIKSEKVDCSGCTACYAVCPTSAVTMRPDIEGFLYPEIDEEKCIHCDRCQNVCPFERNYKDKITKPQNIDLCEVQQSFQEQEFYAGIHTKQEIHEASRSGGLFFAMAELILERGGCIYGVALDPELNAVFKRIEQIDQLETLQGSKYVQAEKADIFVSVATDLKNGKSVLFSGTACEVAGLKAYVNFVGISDDRLYTVDLICHGTPSPKMWRENIQELEIKWKQKIVVAQFRDKSLGWKSHIESYQCLDNSGKLTKKKYANKYTSLFYSNVFLRPSCHNCQFCNFERVGDVSIGDFWGAFKSDNNYDLSKGISQLLVNSEKGKKLLDGLKNVQIEKITKEEASKQPNLFRPTPVSARREEFWQMYEAVGYTRVADSFYKLTEKVKIPYNLLKNWRK